MQGNGNKPTLEIQKKRYNQVKKKSTEVVKMALSCTEGLCGRGGGTRLGQWGESSWCKKAESLLENFFYE